MHSYMASFHNFHHTQANILTYTIHYMQCMSPMYFLPWQYFYLFFFCLDHLFEVFIVLLEMHTHLYSPRIMPQNTYTVVCELFFLHFRLITTVTIYIYFCVKFLFVYIIAIFFIHDTHFSVCFCFVPSAFCIITATVNCSYALSFCQGIKF